MILHRIAASLKSRDWGTVVLEVLIVVVGIFIGLQVDDWNEGRIENQLEQAILVSLAKEFRANIELVEGSIRAGEGKQKASRELLARVADQAANEEDLDGLLADLTFWTVSPPADGALESYLLGDKMSVIKSGELREDLAAWPGRFENYGNIQSQDYDTFKTILMPFLFKHASMLQVNNALRGLPGDRSLYHYDRLPRAPNTEINHGYLLGDQEFVGILVLIDWDQEDAIDYGTRLRAQLEQTLALIQRDLDVAAINGVSP